MTCRRTDCACTPESSLSPGGSGGRHGAAGAVGRRHQGRRRGRMCLGVRRRLRQLRAGAHRQQRRLRQTPFTHSHAGVLQID